MRMMVGAGDALPKIWSVTRIRFASLSGGDRYHAPPLGWRSPSRNALQEQFASVRMPGVNCSRGRMHLRMASVWTRLPFLLCLVCALTRRFPASQPFTVTDACGGYPLLLFYMLDISPAWCAIAIRGYFEDIRMRMGA
jgi:hypothetical protein